MASAILCNARRMRKIAMVDPIVYPIIFEPVIVIIQCIFFKKATWISTLGREGSSFAILNSRNFSAMPRT